MQLELAFIYLAIWLLTLWLGSLALETTGMERSKAHFQALSALSGTGFTTRDAESVVNNSTRRRIVTWLIFFGNAGFLTVLILIIISVQSNIGAITIGRFIFIGLLIGLCLLFVWLGMLDRVSNSLVHFFRKIKWLRAEISDRDILYRENDYAIIKIKLHQTISGMNATIGNTPFWKPTITIFAIERDNTVIPFPKADIKTLPGDILLCFGDFREILSTSEI